MAIAQQFVQNALAALRQRLGEEFFRERLATPEANASLTSELLNVCFQTCLIHANDVAYDAVAIAQLDRLSVPDVIRERSELSQLHLLHTQSVTPLGRPPFHL
jgi:hypothetical protein